MGKTHRISIIEDNQNMRESIGAILNSTGNFEIYTTYSNVETAIEEVVIYNSDIVLLDISLPGKSGLTIIPWLRKKNPNILIIMLTIHYDDEFIFEALKLGAIGYLVKNIALKDLIAEINKAIEGGSPMSPKIARRLVREFQVAEKKKENLREILTEQEYLILASISEGKSYKLTGKKLHTSHHNINYHLRKIYEKLHVNNKAEAISKFLSGELG